MRKQALALVAAFGLAACSGGGVGGPMPAKSAVSPTSSAGVTSPTGETGATREIDVSVRGRTIAGECQVAGAEGMPTIVLDSGMGNDRSQLWMIRDALVDRATVCSYDRAGYGGSDPVPTPRPITDLVDDLHAWLTAGKIPAPYFLIGQSQGGADVLLFAVEHPDEVAGFVAMNPGAPCALYLRTVAKVMSKEELAAEVANCRGENDEGVDLRPENALMDATLPRALPYAVMYGWVCAGDEFCERVRPVESADEAMLAELGAGGRFVDVKGADHEIYDTDLDAVLDTIDEVWGEATR